MTPLQIALRGDSRGMLALAEGLGRDPLPAAAACLLACRRRIVVATGFPVDGQPETDGPPGAVAIARALHALGVPGGVALASFPAVLELVTGELPRAVERIVLPLPPDRVSPVEGACVAIECCGTTAEGQRLDMRGADITASSPCFEDAFGDEVLVAIGDGGNEVGMGAAPAGWHAARGVAPPRSRALVLVPAAVSNRGALALVAVLQALTRVDLLPEPEAHVALVERLVARGAVYGVTRHAEATVDGRPADDEGEVIRALAAWASGA